jgi:hypothetical protein
MTEDMCYRVKEIAGEDGFWKSSSESIYLENARKLLEKGFSEDETIDILSDLYYAAANCFGGG